MDQLSRLILACWLPPYDPEAVFPFRLSVRIKKKLLGFGTGAEGRNRNASSAGVAGSKDRDAVEEHLYERRPETSMSWR